MTPEMSAIRGLALGALLWLGGGGCRPIMPAAATAEYVTTERGGLSVGAARVDITPPPGVSMFGHGPGARVAVGHWTRLYCRAFYVEPQDRVDDPVVIVPCELPQVSTRLVREAAARIRSAAAAAELPAGDVDALARRVIAPRLMVTATHTHAGPGHFFENKRLGGATSSHYPGFDPGLVDYLADRIAQAVVLAYRDRAHAELRWVGTYLWGIAQNGEIDALRLNAPGVELPDPTGLLTPEAGPHPALALSEEQRAIDPSLRLVEFRRADTRAAIGSIAFYAMHPTVIGNQNQHFGGDAYGVAARRIERELLIESTAGAAPVARGSEGEVDPAAATGRPVPVHAIINTNQADASPARAMGNEADATRKGEALAWAIWTAHTGTRRPNPDVPGADLVAEPTQGAWDGEPIVGSRYLDAFLPSALLREDDLGSDDPASGRTLCKKSAMGYPTTRGATANPSVGRFMVPPSLDDVDYRDPAGDPRRQRHCQRPKKVPFFGSGEFVEVAPLAVVRLGDTFVSFVPAETTLTVGARINQAVIAATEGAVAHADAVIAGLANGYVDYVTTFEEYQLQTYHGASTLYGEHTAELLRQAYQCLTQHLLGGPVECPRFVLNGVKSPGQPYQARMGVAYGYRYDRAVRRRPRTDVGGDAPRRAASREVVGLCQLPPRGPTEGGETPVFCLAWDDRRPGPVLEGDAERSERWLVGLAQAIAPEVGSTQACYRALLLPLDSFDPAVTSTLLAPVDDRGVDFVTGAVRRLSRIERRAGGKAAEIGLEARRRRSPNTWRWSTTFSPTAAEWEQILQLPEDAPAVLRIRGERAGSGASEPEPQGQDGSVPDLYSPPLFSAVYCSASTMRYYCHAKH